MSIAPEAIVTSPSANTGGFVTLFNQIYSFIQSFQINVSYKNPLTSALSTMISMGCLYSATNPFGLLIFRVLSSKSPNFDSRIYEGSSTTSVNDAQGQLTIDSGKTLFNCPIQSTYYNDCYTVNPPSTLVGNSTEFLKLNYQNINPLQQGTSVIQASTKISMNAPSISLGNTGNTIQLSYENGSITLTSSNYIKLSAPQIYLNGDVQNSINNDTNDPYHFFEAPPINQVWFNPFYQIP